MSGGRTKHEFGVALLAITIKNAWHKLLLERGLQAAQHTELGEHEGSGVVTVERAHFPVLHMEDIDQTT